MSHEHAQAAHKRPSVPRGVRDEGGDGTWDSLSQQRMRIPSTARAHSWLSMDSLSQAIRSLSCSASEYAKAPHSGSALSYKFSSACTHPPAHEPHPPWPFGYPFFPANNPHQNGLPALKSPLTPWVSRERAQEQMCYGEGVQDERIRKRSRLSQDISDLLKVKLTGVLSENKLIIIIIMNMVNINTILSFSCLARDTRGGEPARGMPGGCTWSTDLLRPAVPECTSASPSSQSRPFPASPPEPELALPDPRCLCRQPLR